MYFEVYADVFLLLQFMMNYYVLALVNSMLRQKVRLRRLVAGAFGGTVFSLIPFLLPLKVVMSMFISIFMWILWMVIFTFRIKRKEHFFKVLEKLSISTILMGGGLLVLLRIFTQGMSLSVRVLWILLFGGIVCSSLIMIIKKNRKRTNYCRVTLFRENQGDISGEGSPAGVAVEALIDTGNSLIEPISGSPVAVLDKSIFEQIFEERKPSVFRVIPYHSVGKKSGVLPGYRLEHIVVETEENTKEYKEVYIGVGEDILSEESTYKMILNPRLLE